MVHLDIPRREAHVFWQTTMKNPPGTRRLSIFRSLRGMPIYRSGGVTFLSDAFAFCISSRRSDSQRDRAATLTPLRDNSASVMSSYASALKAQPTDWRLEFSIEGHPISLETTIYRAIHQHEAQKLNKPSLYLSQIICTRHHGQECLRASASA